MIVNKYKIVLPENDQYLNIPLEMNWDFLGRDDSIEVYQETMVKEVVGGVNDFEVLQFSHNEYVNNLKNMFTGWECTMGINHILVDPYGNIRKSACKQAKVIGNIVNFKGLPEMVPEICTIKYCTCTNDVLIPKIKK